MPNIQYIKKNIPFKELSFNFSTGELWIIDDWKNTREQSRSWSLMYSTYTGTAFIQGPKK